MQYGAVQYGAELVRRRENVSKTKVLARRRQQRTFPNGDKNGKADFKIMRAQLAFYDQETSKLCLVKKVLPHDESKTAVLMLAHGLNLWPVLP